MHLVREENLAAFMEVLRKEYYEKYGYSEEQIQQGLFASKPSAGACYFEGLKFYRCFFPFLLFWVYSNGYPIPDRCWNPLKKVMCRLRIYKNNILSAAEYEDHDSIRPQLTLCGMSA